MDRLRALTLELAQRGLQGALNPSDRTACAYCLSQCAVPLHRIHLLASILSVHKDHILNKQTNVSHLSDQYILKLVAIKVMEMYFVRLQCSAEKSIKIHYLIFQGLSSRATVEINLSKRKKKMSCLTQLLIIDIYFLYHSTW